MGRGRTLGRSADALGVRAALDARDAVAPLPSPPRNWGETGPASPPRQSTEAWPRNACSARGNEEFEHLGRDPQTGTTTAARSRWRLARL